MPKKKNVLLTNASGKQMHTKMIRIMQRPLAYVDPTQKGCLRYAVSTGIGKHTQQEKKRYSF